MKVRGGGEREARAVVTLGGEVYARVARFGGVVTGSKSGLGRGEGQKVFAGEKSERVRERESLTLSH